MFRLLWAILTWTTEYTVWSKSLCAPNNPHTIDDLKMAITEYIRNVDRAILNTVFENTVRRENKSLETGRGHFEH
jgi:predicted transcriptional regulator